MFEKLKENRDLIITIGINLLMPIVYFMITLGFLVLSVVIFWWSYDFSPKEVKYYYANILFLLICIIFLCLLILRICILPFIYYLLEKKSENIIVKNFIYELKNNKKMRRTVLLIVEFPVLVFLSAITLLNCQERFMEKFADFVCLHAHFTFCFDLLGCYIALFLWWKFRGELK